MPDRAQRPTSQNARPVARAVAHLAVVGLVAFTAAVGIAGLNRGNTSRGGLSFDVVSTARGAADGLQLRSASFILQPDPANADPLLSRRILPTPKPAPTAKPAPTPKPAPRYVAVRVLAPAPAPAPVAAVVGNAKLLWPVPGAVITQYFWAGHLAIDMATDPGNPVLAAASGTVMSAGWRSNGGGLVIEINHGNGLHTLYNHLGAILVSPGQFVGRGQRIASVGCTGLCTGPHVHFQVRVGGIFVNPLRYL